MEKLKVEIQEAINGYVVYYKWVKNGNIESREYVFLTDNIDGVLEDIKIQLLK